eukprot:3309689-Alexandrium_andersonii.AAC.1
MQQREQLARHLQEELEAERLKSATDAQASRASNEHLEQLVREDAAPAQAEQARLAQGAKNEIAALRETVRAMASGEHAP